MPKIEKVETLTIEPCLQKETEEEVGKLEKVLRVLREKGDLVV